MTGVQTCALPIYGQGILEGYVKKTIKFEERNTVDLKDLKGETTIFHYNQDGSIDVLVVSDKKYREAIRRTYKVTKPIVDIANRAGIHRDTIYALLNGDRVCGRTQYALSRVMQEVWHSPKSVDTYDVKTEMEKCKCNEPNTPLNLKTRWSNKLSTRVTQM